MKRLTRALACAICLAAFGASHAADSGGSSSPPPSWGSAKGENAALKAAQAALAGGDYAAAQAQLKSALATDPGNADLHNLYAYSIRKGPNPDMPLVFKHYEEALRLDPKHRGAHEYIGEAYLMVGNPAKAREHLAALDKLCTFSCAEYDMLKKALAAYDAKTPK
jgi:tetratricopeptide (TPR) repeat protein